MVDVIGRAKVIVSGDVDSRSIDQAGGKIGDSLKRGAVVGGAALASLAAGGVRVYQAFEVAEAQSRKLNTVLDNVGEGNAAPAVEKLADELMRLTAIDDEVIKGGQTILATFDAVSASAGETGGTFERATRASVDMAAVFGSVESASRVLGKALSEPEKAAALLRRSNVVLSEEQKTLIENFTAAGDAAGAQDVILSALEDRYEGTAEAAKTNSESIKTAFGELEESAGNLVASLAGGGKDKGGGLTGAIYKVSDALNETAESEAWGDLGKDIRGTSSNVSTLTGNLLKFDKKIATTLDKLPGFRRGLLNLIDPTHGLAEAFLDLAGALGNVNSENQKLLDKPIESYGGTGLESLLNPTGRAGGGPVSSGLVKVGENGPELVQFGDSGGYVYNNSQTREMLSDAGGDTYTNIFNITGPTSLAELRQQADWYNTYGTRFGGAT